MYKKIIEKNTVAEKELYKKIVAITNRHLCDGELIFQIELLCKAGVSAIILREKDMTEKEYEMLAEKAGATYITASHIYETDCKKGLEPKGIDYLKEVCKAVSIPVYALGGINYGNMAEALDAGAEKVCMMSEMMRMK